MFWFLLLCACTLAGLALLIFRSELRPVGAVILFICAIWLVLDSTTIVGARELAVQTRFGKVQGKPLGAGFHWVDPINNIETFDASVQTLKYYQGEEKDDGDCITVRLGNSTPACVDVTVQWNINYLGDVNDLYLKYKTFDNIHDNLVRRQLGSALNEVFGTYDPLAAINSDSDVPTITTKHLQANVKSALQTDLGTAITIDDVVIPIVHFDVDTENRLKSYQQAKADTRIAKQNEQTATAQAAANKALADQAATKDTGVQYQNCLNLIAQLGKTGQLGQLPPAFTCAQGGSSPSLLINK